MIESVSVRLKGRSGTYQVSQQDNRRRQHVHNRTSSNIQSTGEHTHTWSLSLPLSLSLSLPLTMRNKTNNGNGETTAEATVFFLDDTTHVFQLQRKSRGKSLIDDVFQYLELSTDRDYFGLQLTDNGLPPSPSNISHTKWLDHHKKIDRQVKVNFNFWFGVRFWVDEPSKIDGTARTLMCQQLRKMLQDGRLQAPRPTRLLLASYRAQAELGDWTIGGDISSMVETGIESPEDMRRVKELHRLHRSQTKSTADLHYLEHARRLDRYGVEAHPAKDSNGKDIGIGITSHGIVVFQSMLRVNTFSWAKIVKLSYKRKQFFIQLKREASENYDTMVGFNTCSSKAAKALFRSCVEQHGFHRLQKIPSAPKYPTPLHRFFIRSPRRRELEEGKTTNGGSFGRGSLARVQEGQAALQPRPAWGAQITSNSDDEGGFLERALRVPLGYADEDDDDEEDDLGIVEPAICADVIPSVPDTTEHVIQDIGGESGLVTVRLSADNAGRYGFNIRGGAEFDTPIVVSRVVATAVPSDVPSPHLQEGDQVIAINGVSVERLRQEQVIQLIRSARGTLTITLKPNAEYSCSEEEEPIVQYVPESGSTILNDNGGDGWRQALLLIADGLGGAALQQFERLPKRAEHAVTAAKLPQNLSKNRYRDIAPYDCSRVILSNGQNGDYINASYINLEVPSTSIVHSYIATQGPLPHTMADFWQMVLESGSTLIVMLGALAERGRVKCHQYWASPGKGIRPGGANGPHIQTLAELPDSSAAAVHRHLLISDPSGRSRAIHHLQYLAWPDHGVPTAPDTFLGLAGRLAALRPTTAPAIIHCSAGVGRTGALLLMDHALALLRHSQPVYPLDLVKNLRDQRPLCVQNANQYKFICECIGSAAQNMGLLPSEQAPPTSPSAIIND